MPRVVQSTVIDAPAEAVWALLRDFDAQERWNPAVTDIRIEQGRAGDRVGCTRNFRLSDGSRLREQLLALSDADMAFSYCLLDTPLPLLNFTGHVHLVPVTDGDRTFWRWDCRFDAPADDKERLRRLVAKDIQQAGFNSVTEIFSKGPSSWQ
jgi:ligand-binding SRPBCC domain-containing protein